MTTSSRVVGKSEMASLRRLLWLQGGVGVFGWQVPHPEMDFEATSTSLLTVMVGNSTVQPYLPTTSTYRLERKGVRSRSALRKCAVIGEVGECPVERSTRKFYGAIYAFWQESLSFNCTDFPALPYEGQSVDCYFLAETCQDADAFVDEQGLNCGWYGEEISRCAGSPGASDACCVCQGGNVAATLVQCATENAICNFPGSYAAQGGGWVYVGAISDHTQSGVDNFVCGEGTVDALDTEIPAARFCYLADTRNLRTDWRAVGTGSIESEWRLTDARAVPLMTYQYRVVRTDKISDPSEPRNFFAAPATTEPVPVSAGGTISGRMTLEWEEPLSYVKPVSYEIFVNGNLAMGTSVRVWSLTDCVENEYYDIKVFPIVDGVQGRPSARLGRFCGDPPGAPSQPELVSSTCSTARSPTITIRWTPPKDPGSRAITSFRFLRASEPNLDTYVLIDPVSGVAAHVFEFTDAYTGDIQPGKVYRYKVFATNGVDDADFTHASVPLTVLCNSHSCVLTD